MSSGTELEANEQAVRQRLLADMNPQLDAALATKEFSAYRSSRNQLWAELKNRLDAAFAEFRSEVANIIEIELTQHNSMASRKRELWYFWSSVSAALLVVLYLMVTIPIRYDHAVLFTPNLTTLTSVVWVEIAALAFSLLILGISAAIAGVLPAARKMVYQKSEHERAALRYGARLKIFVAEQMRLIIPSLPEPLTKVAFLEYSSALVELALAEPISTAALASVERFVKGHEASALGLAGPRGAGKTTILNFLTSMEKTLGIYVPAPVRYEPNELLTRIFEELANKYLGQNWELTAIDYMRRRIFLPTLLVTPIIILGALIGGIALYVQDPRLTMDTSRWLGVLLVLSVIALSIFWLKRFNDLRRLRLNSYEVDSSIQQAETILRNLRWQQQRTSTSTLKAEPWGGVLKAESEKSASDTQRDIGRPQLVADFQSFIRKINKSDKFDRLIIAIDELDKLASTDDLIAVINEIKDILHIEGTHVIVSVSYDALYRFLLRGLPTRDVFDSAFDEIIQVPMLNASESIEVLQKRAVGFPANWGLACYVVSGGLPRDLLRYGRRCVEIYRLSDVDIASVPRRLLGELAAEKVTAEFQTRGIASRLTIQGRDELESAVRAARQGSISGLVRLVNEIYESTPAPIREWLAWLTDVTDFLQSGGDEKSDKAAFLARRSVVENIEGLWR